MRETGTPNQLQEQLEKKPEIMPNPTISIKPERGALLFSLLLKAENPQWGETKTPLAQETTDYFQKNPINESVLTVIKKLQQLDIDEETLYNLALTYQKPERAKRVFSMAQEYKPHIKNLEQHYDSFISVLEQIDQIFSNSPLAEKFAQAEQQDIEERLKRLPELTRIISGLIDFFKPDINTTNVKDLIFLPTNPLYPQNAGRNFSAFEGEQIIISHVENTMNQEHEFLHGIINPIVKKIFSILTEQQKQAISNLASGSLKQLYKETNPFSILCEELIKTYNEVFEIGGQPQTYEDFLATISSVSEEYFQSSLKNPYFKSKCQELGITTKQEFLDKSQQYYQRFQNNPLRKIIFELYQEYDQQNNPETNNFERFILKNLPERLKQI